MPVQVVDLMAEASGHDTSPLRLKECAGTVLGPDLYTHRALHHPPHPGYAETTLKAVLDLLRAFNDLGIDQFQHLIILVHHNDAAAQNSHLGSCKAGAARVGEGLFEVVQQIMEPVVN